MANRARPPILPAAWSLEPRDDGANQAAELTPGSRTAQPARSGGRSPDDQPQHNDPRPTAAAALDPGLSFSLHSDPTATRIVYLDFDGHTTSGTLWNGGASGAPIVSPAYDIDGDPTSFSGSELERIQQIWQRVASDFAPFAVDVTTQAPPLDWLSRSSSSDSTYGIRVVVTSSGPSSGAGGVAYMDSFTWDSDTPAFVYKTSTINVAETISHEVGHTLGLSHDGSTTSAYYSGHGSGEEGWAPIMGASTSKNVTTWDDGTFTGSTNSGQSANQGKGPDDLAVITTYNGFSYRPDSEGESLLNTVPLPLMDGSFGQFGTITTRSDQDWFSFSLTSAGILNLSADPYWSRAFVDGDGLWGGSTWEQLGPVADLDPTTSWVENGANLDLSVEVLDGSGRVVAASNPAGLRAGFAGLSLPAGSYVLKVDGVGSGDPTAATPTGYSDYASIGNYWLSGNLSAAVPPPPAGLPTLSASDARVVEGNSGGLTSYQLNVALSTVAAEDVILTFATRDGTATSKGKGADFTAIADGRLVIPKGQISGQVTLGIVADLRSEPDEGFSVEFTSVSGAALGRSAVVITIVNDDIISGGGVRKAAALAFASPDDQPGLTGSEIGGTDPLTGGGRPGTSAASHPSIAQTMGSQSVVLVPSLNGQGAFMPGTAPELLGWCCGWPASHGTAPHPSFGANWLAGLPVA